MKLHWVIFALATVLCWGLYGALLNWGAAGFHHDRIKAFLFVGVAYFLVAVLAPAAIIAINGSGFDFGKSPEGIKWSLIAGTAGAIGALTLLYALSGNIPKGATPAEAGLGAAQVMAVVFAGAPVVAALFAVYLKSQQPGASVAIKPMFIVGILLSAAGGAIVTLFK